MSKNIWQMQKQNEKLRYGRSVTSRIEAYVQAWENRCYPDGIPDTVPDKLLFSGRAPSWKAIAMCILNNDFALRRLGLTSACGDSGTVRALERRKKESDSGQTSFL